MIIILTQCFPSRVGGIETLMYDLALNLSLKHDVKVLADQQDSAKDLEFDKNNKNFSILRFKGLKFLRKRKKVYIKYNFELKNFDKNLTIPKYSKEIRSANHLFIINIAFNNIKKTKDDFIKYLITKNIITQQHYIPIYKFNVFGKKINKFKGAEKYFSNSISIPIFVDLNIKDQNKIINMIKKYFK